jgi:hypothetical protein
MRARSFDLAADGDLHPFLFSEDGDRNPEGSRVWGAAEFVRIEFTHMLPRSARPGGTRTAVGENTVACAIPEEPSLHGS